MNVEKISLQTVWISTNQEKLESVIHYTSLMERIPCTNKLVRKMESFWKMCRNAKMKILSIKASAFHWVSLGIPRIMFMTDTLNNIGPIMALNYRLAKVYIYVNNLEDSGTTVTTSVNCFVLWTFVPLLPWRLTGGLHLVWPEFELEKLLSRSVT